MTQVQDMTDMDLDFELANLMGWKEEEHQEYDFPIFRKPDGSFIRSLGWRPCTDPAASLEVQAKALEVNHKRYILQLGEGTRRGRTDLDEMFKDMLNASPRERAEAAYITLSSVKE